MLIASSSTLRRLLPFLLFLSLSAGMSISAQNRAEFRDVITNLDLPVDILWGNDNYLWIAQKNGAILRVNPETGVGHEVGSVADLFSPEELGLFGMALDPAFEDSAYIYLYYSYIRTYPNGDWQHLGKVVRYFYDRSADKLVSPTTIVDSLQAVVGNVGGALRALPDRTLLIGVGDGGDFFEEAQSHESMRGKILRVRLDGTIPADNPWPNYPYPLNSIWATGFRNPISIALDHLWGTVYATDWGGTSHGEVNILEGGRNYGWPYVFGKCDGDPIDSEGEFCADSNVVEPIIDWYSGSILSARPTDIEPYHGEQFPEWEGSLIVTTLLDGLHQLRLDDEGKNVLEDNVYISPRVFSDMPGQLRSLCISPEGRVFIGTGNLGEDQKSGDNRVVEILEISQRDSLEETPLVTRNVVTGLRLPWEILWGFDNYIWCTERGGNVRRINPETGDVHLLLNIPDVLELFNNGLLGMALHPNFCDTSQVFLVYSYQHPEVSHRILQRLVRYTYDPLRDTLVDPLVLIDSIEASPEHMGSRVLITPDRHILITTGDADGANDPQGVDNLNGKVLRIGIDGAIPPDNPWADQPWPASLVWSRGHRNPQGLTLTPDGKLYASEHGPWTDDEVNLIRSGADYGWPSVEGYCDLPQEIAYCQDHSITEPIIAWTPTIAPCGLEYYKHDAIPEWKNSLLLATLKNKRLMNLHLNARGDKVVSVHEYFSQEFGRLRDVCVAPDGRVFLATSNHDRLGEPTDDDDRIIEIRSAKGHPSLPQPGALCDRPPASVDSAPQFSIGELVIPHPIIESGEVKLGSVLGKGKVRVISAAGKVVREEEFNGGSSLRFVKGLLSPGLYIIEVVDNKQVVRSQVIVR